MGTENVPTQFQINTSSITLTLPLPLKNERQKYVVKSSEDNGYVISNMFREQEIKDVLFKLETQNKIIPELESKLLEKERPVSFIESGTTSSILIGLSIGLLSGMFIFKK